MNFGFCSVALIPCRAESSDRSELVNQLLFGETYQVLEETEKWLQIETTTDKYVGWIDRKLHTPLDKAELDNFLQNEKSCITEPIFQFNADSASTIVGFGARFPVPQGNSFKLGKLTFSLNSAISAPPTSITELSRRFLNAPYLWGGKSLFGIDCSGFTQVVFRCFGKDIPRDAYQQAQHGQTINLNAVQPGDLAFFGDPHKKITHVGICLENGEIIHASGKCRIDVLDSKGILNRETGEYTHELRLIKRL